MKFNIQVVSDIHLEFYKSFPRIPPAPETEILVLAGDIGTLAKEELLIDFLTYCSANWSHVLYVPGNHELYHSRKTHTGVMERLREITGMFPNIHFLVNNEIILEPRMTDLTGMRFPIRFYGTPLFPKITGEMSERMTDFEKIHTKDARGWTVPIKSDDWNRELHEPQHEWLMTELGKHKALKVNVPVVVITHYPPVREGTSHPRFSAEPTAMKQYFSGDLEEEITAVLLENSVVISGHTHYCYDFIRKGVRFVSRAMGYPNEVRESGFMDEGRGSEAIVITVSEMKPVLLDSCRPESSHESDSS
jgi:predicted phosphodiesterase